MGNVLDTFHSLHHPRVSKVIHSLSFYLQLLPSTQIHSLALEGNFDLYGKPGRTVRLLLLPFKHTSVPMACDK